MDRILVRRLLASPLNPSIMDPHIEQSLKAIDMFKDWSNYLLVTTVAALGWVATKDRTRIPPKALRWTIGALGASTVFAIFTLALIPLVAEAVTPTTTSIYDVAGTFNLLWMFPPRCPLTLKWVCWPQHILFLVGILVFTIANIKATKQ